MKDIKEILQELDLDLSNPEVVKAASEAIMQILSGRMGDDPETLKDKLSKKAKRPDDPDDDDSEPIDLGTIEQEIDPNLIQPPQRPRGGENEVETEIEDDEDVLNKIRQLGDNEDEGDGGQGKQPPNNNDKKKKGDEPGEPGDEPGEPGDEPGDGPGGDPGDPGDKPGDGPGGDPGDEPGGDPGRGNGSGNNPLEDPGDDIPRGNGGGGSDDNSGNKPTEDPNEPGGGGDAGGEEEEGEDSDSDFTSKVSGKNPKNEAQRIQISRTLKAAAKAQSKAEDAGQGAIASLLEKCQEMLEEMLDELADNPSEEINEKRLSQVIQKTLDAISEVTMADLTYKSEEDRARQVKQIKDTMSDAATSAELSAEDVEQIRADKQAIINNKREIDKYASRSRSSFSGFEAFITSLRRALALQVESEKTKAGSWSAINRRFDGTSVVKPGIKKKTLPSTKVPVIDFYFDCSGSWTDYDLQKGDDALSKLAQLEQDGEIKINVFYFADNVYADVNSPRREGGTSAWNRIIDNIVLTKATNVVIMTDSDMEWQCSDPPHRGYKVSGVVWFLWKNGVNAQKLPHLLQGKSGTLQFAFDSN